MVEMLETIHNFILMAIGQLFWKEYFYIFIKTHLK